MDPLSAIVGALVAGASAAATNVASRAVSDAYDGLKSIIATRFNRKAAVEMIEEKPDSRAAQEGLEGTLREAKVDQDPDVMRLAEILAAALKDLPPTDLSRANITAGDIDGYRDAIVRGLNATGNVQIGNITARTGDAMLSDVSAGAPPPKNR